MGAPKERSSSRGRSGRATSLGGGKIRSGHKVHGFKEKENRARSRSRDPNRKKKFVEYNTPFDEKGRCHYHKNIQLAAKKNFGGGWKILHEICPKCMEEATRDGDDQSVKSGRSLRSTSKKMEQPQTSSSTGGKSKKKWNLFKGSTGDQPQVDDDDDRSVKSNKSTRSNRSSRSTSKRGQAASSSRYGSMPFDGDGYCVHHPSIQLAKKKKLGGFKIIHDVCPNCMSEAGGRYSRSSSRDSRRSRSRSRPRKKLSDDEKSERSSRSRGSAKRKKRIRVKNLKTDDGNGKEGRYSGYVNDEHQPNGEGTIKYKDGSEWEGVWESGFQVDGRLKAASQD